jgi:hypothetical protein
MRSPQMPDAAKVAFIGANLEEVLAASAFVRPYWSELYRLRQEVSHLRRSFARQTGSARDRATVNAELNKIERQTKSLLASLDKDAPRTDPTGKISLLQEAIHDCLFACADRSLFR